MKIQLANNHSFDNPTKIDTSTDFSPRELLEYLCTIGIPIVLVNKNGDTITIDHPYSW